MESKNLSPMALFTHTERVKREGQRQVGESQKPDYSNIINILDIKVKHRKGGVKRIKEHFPTLYGVKQQEKKSKHNTHFILIFNYLQTQYHSF